MVGDFGAIETAFKRLRPQDDRHDRAAALLHGRDGDSLPAVHPSRRFDSLNAHLGPSGHERQDGRDAQHRRIADDAVHRVALGNGLGQRQSHRGFRRRSHLALESHPCRRPADVVHLPAKLTASSVEHPDGIADAQPEHAAEMLGFLRREVDHRAVTGETRREEAGVHRATIIAGSRQRAAGRRPLGCP
jgi:hypothetical protein